jgi:DNA-binding CsgD family transcriptional regulator
MMGLKVTKATVLKLSIVVVIAIAYFVASYVLYLIHQNVNFQHSFRFELPFPEYVTNQNNLSGHSMEIKEVYLSGNFIDWAEREEGYKLEPQEDGSYTLTVPLLSGRNEYKYVVYLRSRRDPVWTHDPKTENLIPDGHSGFNSYVDMPDTWGIGDGINLIFFLLALFYGLYLLLDLVSFLVFRYGLGPKSRVIVILWLVILVTFAIGTYRGIISERKWARWLFEDSLNMVHRVMEGQGIDYSGIRTDEQINTFSRTTREIMVKALPRTEAHPFNNSEIFLNSLFLLDSDLNLLYVAQSEETRKKDLTVYRKLGFARIKDFIEKSLLVGIRERFATAPPPRGMLSFHSSPADYQNEKPFPYGICRFLLGYDVIIKPIYHNTVVVGYYGAMIPPNIFGQAMLDTLLFNAVVAFILSALILTYFAYWRTEKPEHSFMVDRFVKRFELSKREEEIIRLYYKGYSNVYISKKFGISSGTVKSHIHSVYQKAGVGQKVELLQLIQDLD